MSNPIKAKMMDVMLECHIVVKGIPMVTVGAMSSGLDIFENKLTFDNVPRGKQMPQTLENLQAVWARDQELIFEQKEEIAELKKSINQKNQKMMAMAAKRKGNM